MVAKMAPSPFAVRSPPPIGGGSIFAAGKLPVGGPLGRAPMPATPVPYAPKVAPPAVAPAVTVMPPSNVCSRGPLTPTIAPRAIPSPVATRSLTPTSTTRNLRTSTPPVPMMMSSSVVPAPPLVSGSYTAAPITSGSYTAAPIMSGSYSAAPPMLVPTGSYAPPVPVSGSYTAAPLIVPTGSYAPPVAPPVSGSYTAAPLMAHPVSGSYTAAPLIVPGSFAPPMSGSYTPAPLIAPTGSYAGPPVLSGSRIAPKMALPFGGPLIPPPIPPPLVPTATPPLVQVPTAAPPLASTGSYAPPVMVPSGSYTPPAVDTRELPDPATVERQKQVYKDSLDRQFHAGLAQIANEREAKREFLRQQAEQQKAAFTLQVQSRLDSDHLAFDSDLNNKLMGIQEQAMLHRKTLEEKAAALTLDYQQKKASEELLQRQYQIQRAFIESELKLASEFRVKQGSLRAPIANRRAP